MKARGPAVQEGNHREVGEAGEPGTAVAAGEEEVGEVEEVEEDGEEEEVAGSEDLGEEDMATQKQTKLKEVNPVCYSCCLQGLGGTYFYIPLYI